MQEACDLKVHVNGHHTFLLHQRIICEFSGKLRRMMKQERRGVKWRSKGSGIQIKEFPGGAHGFELVARFCYNNGRIAIDPSNVCLLHCAAILLEMTEAVADCNLLTQTEAFLEGLFRWTWSETVAALRSCELLIIPPTAADSVLELLISGLLKKISSSSEIPSSLNSSSSSSSSCSSPGAAREWWFDDLAALSPSTVERIAKALGANGRGGRRGGNLTLTRFLLHYLESSRARPGGGEERYGGLADAAVQGVLAAGRAGFSCRGLFGVMRAVARLGVSAEARRRLESMVGEVVDQATLDDLLVSGEAGGAAYDVNLVVRLVRTFVGSSSTTTTGLEEEEAMWLQRLKKVGRLVDKYLAEISPDSSLKVSKFSEVAESLPDSARDCFDGVYRALDIYLQSHPALSIEERTRLCGCLNYEKLTLEACKDLAKNRRIPPGVAVQALVSQQSKLHSAASPEAAQVDEEEELRINLQRMQCRVRELEKLCRSMKGRMSRMDEKKSRSISHGRKGMPRLC